MKAAVYRLSATSPSDTSGLDDAIARGDIRPETIVAVLGKTEGTGCVNDFTRGFATVSFRTCLSRHLGVPAAEAAWDSGFAIGHAVMDDALDAAAVDRTLRLVDAVRGWAVGTTQSDHIVALLCKAEAARMGTIRGHRHTMLDDSDINATRHARALVGGVIAGRVGDTRLFVSGGAEHQGPDGGGPLAVIVTLET